MEKNFKTTMRRGVCAVLILLATGMTGDANAQKKGTKPGDLPVKTLTRQDPPQGATVVYGPYAADVRSIRSHECPEWFRDAKFGMFIDWGVYSVAGWAPKQEKGAM
ncbi:MAG: alpha-L-fucosidase, partial [Tannerella sp.]|nr:alpha-L-fucosidase [Tannerella sp.]